VTGCCSWSAKGATKVVSVVTVETNMVYLVSAATEIFRWPRARHAFLAFHKPLLLDRQSREIVA
jgi:hypothetical protein